MHESSRPADDPGWNLPAALILTDGRVAVLPELTVRDAVDVVERARKFGILIGGAIDPSDVVGVGPDPDADDPASGQVVSVSTPRWFLRWHAEHIVLDGRPHRPHDLRHSYASAALADATGWHDMKVISQRLGHSKVAITLDTYSHVLPAADETIAHTLANVILGPQ